MKVARMMAFGAAFGAMFSLAACGEPTNDTLADEPVAQNAPDDIEFDPIPIMGPEVQILAFGDSLFAGYGLADAKGDSYPAKLEASLRSRGVNAVIRNAGVSGDTSAEGRERLGFVLESEETKPDLFILELGGNDLLRGLSPDETRQNFEAMLDTLKAKDIPVLIMGMRAPPNYGPEYQQAFDALMVNWPMSTARRSSPSGSKRSIKNLNCSRTTVSTRRWRGLRNLWCRRLNRWRPRFLRPRLSRAKAFPSGRHPPAR